MIRHLKTISLLFVLIAMAMPVLAAEPDYAPWTALLQKYYSPQNGMDYKGLRTNDAAALAKLTEDLSKVDAGKLERNEQLAFWLNLYNISTVKVVCDNYPLTSIRELSTDPIVRLNVFKKERVPQSGKLMSLDDIENVKIREGFKDPRIHFAINCASKSCPPMRQEAFVGARVNEQLDDQARSFLNGTGGAKIVKSGSKATLTVSKLFDWYGKDFVNWGGGVVPFVKKFVAAEKRAQLEGAKVTVAYYEYSWDLNDWKR